MKRNKRTLAAGACAALAISLLATRPALAAPAARDNELLASGGFFHSQGSDVGDFNLALSWGRYLGNPAWELGLLQTLNWRIVDGEDDPWSATTAPFLQYDFLGIGDGGRVVPFIGALAGLAWNDQDATGALGPLAGLKFFVNDSTFVQTAYRFEWFFDNLEQANDDSEDGIHVVSLGIGYVWGGQHEG